MGRTRPGCRPGSRPSSTRRAGAINGWDTEFEDSVPGLVTLRDAARYIQKLSKAEQAKPHWNVATAVLIEAAEGRLPVMLARGGMLRAMNHGDPRVFSDRKDTQWGKRKLKREQ